MMLVIIGMYLCLGIVTGQWVEFLMGVYLIYVGGFRARS